MLSDFRVAFRLLRRKPAFTVVAVLTLGVGIGANAAMFSVVNGVLLRPLPYDKAEQLVSVYTRYEPATGYDFPYFALSGPEYADVRDRVRTFAAVAAYDYASVNLAGTDNEPERLLAGSATARLFDVLRVRPLLGRGFNADDERRGAPCVTILTHGTWVERFGQRPTIVGSTVRIDGAPCDVVGVMPQGLAFPNERIRLWRPLVVDTEETDLNRGSHPIAAIARLRDGVTIEQAQAELQGLRAYWSEKFPDHYAKGHYAVIRALHEDLVGDQGPVLFTLLGAVAFVLLMVCVNLASLLLSRGEARRLEFAVRSALGAPRGRLMRQLLVESLLVALVGGMLGLLLANWLLAGVLALYPNQLPETLTIDRQTLAFVLGLIVLAGFLFGVLPAMHATGVSMQETLKSDGRTFTGSRRGLFVRSTLVVGQVALSATLIVGAMLMLRTYQHLRATDLGFDPERMLTFSVSLPAGRQPDAAAARRTLVAIEQQLAAMSGTESSGAISNLPLASGGPPDDFSIEGRPAPAPGQLAWNARYLMATPGVFATMRIPLVRGRMLASTDGAGQPLVATISETAARRYWPNADPIGARIKYYPLETSPWITIVGIVGDVRSLGVNRPPPPVVYVPFEQAPRPPYEGRSMTFVVRARTTPSTLVSAARAAVLRVDSTLPLASVETMTDVVADAIGEPRFTMLVMAFFACLALFLGALGLYGVLAYMVEQRVREIGVRMALGATRGEILRLVLRRGVLLGVVGIAIGIPAALALSRLIATLLAGVSEHDPLTYAAVVAILIATTVVASYVPARRATRVDPIVALRTS